MHQVLKKILCLEKLLMKLCAKNVKQYMLMTHSVKKLA